MVCVQCGLQPVDLPDSVPADDLFESCGCCGDTYCQACLFEHEAAVEVCS